MPFKTKAPTRVVMTSDGAVHHVAQLYLDKWTVEGGEVPSLALGEEVELVGTQNSDGVWTVSQVSYDSVLVRRPV